MIANAAKKAATAVLQPRNHVEVLGGEQTGLDGIFESIRDDAILLRPRAPDMEDQRIEEAEFEMGARIVLGGEGKDCPAEIQELAAP